jgi:replicative DNA helicase
MTGVPTGFTDLDSLTNGLHPGQMIVLAARPAIGKALALDTPLPTPAGWTTMGEVAVGDLLLGADGHPTRVVAATDVMVDRPCYRVSFSDGTSIVADAQHQWVTTTRAARPVASERKPPSHYWSDDSRRRLALATTMAYSGPDALVCRSEVLEEVGREFLGAFSVAVKTVDRHGRQPRHAAGAKRQYFRAWAAAEHVAVKTTEEIARSVRCADGRANHAVAVAEPMHLPAQDLPLDPYVFGAWLGDGDTGDAMITSGDPEVIDRIRSAGLVVGQQGDGIRYRITVPQFRVTPEPRACEVCGQGFVPATTSVRTCGRSCGGRVVRGGPRDAPKCRRCGGPHSSGYGWCTSCQESHGSVKAILRTMGVLGDKHIPDTYLRASESQRHSLLAGLLDTDGFAGPNGLVQFAVTHRRLAMGVLELVRSLGLKPTLTTKRVKGRTESSSVCFIVGFTTSESVFGLPRKDARRPRSVGLRNGFRFITEVVALESVPVRCVEVDNDQHLYLAGEGMIPTHNSTLGLDIVRSASIRHNLASVIFSLEMSKTEITMRLLSAEAGIQLQHMRKGTMREEDWTRLASTMGRVSEAPLFIDDSPNMSLMEIRAKCRRLKQRDNLKLVVIDYLQLMSSGKKVESRQQEVSEFSRALKLLAKELEVPVVAISQLNRGPEQRTDKKPQMSDLRESGCLTADARVLRADTGAEMSMGELLARGETDVPVWSLDESLRYVRRHLTHVFSTGTRPIFRLTLSSGKQVRATENHPFLTYAGWRSLVDLRVGDKLAVPRHVPAPDRFEHPLTDDEVRLGATLISSRTTARASGRRQVLGCRLGFDVMPSESRRLPPDIACFSKRQIAVFLQSLWALDGRTTVQADASGGRIVLNAKSRQLLDDIVMLLLRFGISAGVSQRRQGWELHITGVDDQRRFLQEVAVHGSLSEEAHHLLAIVRSRRERASAGVRGAGGDEADGDEAGWPLSGVDIAADITDELVEDDAFDLERAAELLASLDLDLEASNDVLWDEVVAIEPDGVDKVFDATVLGGHNFIANGIAVHNSIEQDADMVILLHREEAYERESPRAGEADLIVAKHRNGPTDTIVLAFQGHYSRFTNMAPSF